MKQEPAIAVDLDGVLNLYDGWKGPHEFADPRPGARDFLANAATRYRVVIYTTRDPREVWLWLRKHNLSRDVTEVTDRKPPAKCYVDDRAVRFDGDFVKTLQEIDEFKAHWEK